MRKNQDKFLTLIEKQLMKLSENIVLKNININEYELNIIAPLIIYRLMFLRILEDRNIFRHSLLNGVLDGGDCYEQLLKIFQEAYERYNLKLFQSHESIRLNGIKIDDKVIKKLIQNLRSADFPSDILTTSSKLLARAYEHFLDKTISFKKDSGKIKLSFKRDVRKTGGIYYTPNFIVKYIVEKTLGNIVKDKTPVEIEHIKILDPSCGVGSFLVEAYEYLLAHHLNYYKANLTNTGLINSKGAKFYETKSGLGLSLSERKRILLGNIFGVDIDSKAVEITKLTLLLKCLETSEQLSTENSDVLFDLDENIKCGNALIGSDIKTSGDYGDLKKLNPFDWKAEFRSIIDGGGFDCVIGNPPYVDSEEMCKTQPYLRAYAGKGAYQTAKGNWDLYCIFTERGLSLVKVDAYFAYIIPNKFISLSYGRYLKNYLSNYHIMEIVDYSSLKVFDKRKNSADVYPVVIIINKNTRLDTGIYKRITGKVGKEQTLYTKSIVIKKGDLDWAEKLDVYGELIARLKSRHKAIGEYVNIESPATVSEAYLVKELIQEHKEGRKNCFRFINTGTIDRYIDLWGLKETKYIKDIYIKPIISKDFLLNKFKKRYEQSNSKKIILAGMVLDIESYYDSEGKYYAGKSTVIMRRNERYPGLDLKLLSVIVNSKVFNALFKAINKYNSMSGGYLNVNKNNLKDIPIPNLLTAEKNALTDLYHEIVNRANGFHLNKSVYKKYKFKQNIETLSRSIDHIVYRLYELSDDEIGLIC